MPAELASQILKAYKAKAAKHPEEDRKTLFKFVLWDHFSNRLVSDEEMLDMAFSSANLFDLTMKILEKDRPQLLHGGLRAEVVRKLTDFFHRFAPDELPSQK